MYKTSLGYLLFSIVVLAISVGDSKGVENHFGNTATYENVWVLMCIGDFKNSEGNIDKKTWRAFEGNLRDFSKLMVEEFSIPRKNIHLETNLEEGIKWLSKRSSEKDLIIIHISAHGWGSMSKKEKPSGSGIKLDRRYKYVDVNTSINSLDDFYLHLILIVDACFSGGIIDHCRKKNRWILTACGRDEYEYGNKIYFLLDEFSSANLSKMLFTHNLIVAMKESKTLGEAFYKSTASFWQVLKSGQISIPTPEIYMPNGKDISLRSILKETSTPIIIKKISIPKNIAPYIDNGIMHDGTNLWIPVISSAPDVKVYEIDPINGNILRSYVQNHYLKGVSNVKSLAYDSTNRIIYNYIYPRGPIYAVNAITLNEIPNSKIRVPAHWIHDIAFDSANQILWAVTGDQINSNYKVYKINSTNGSIYGYFTTPTNTHSPFGLTWDGNFLWISEWSDKNLYQIDSDRAIAEGKSENAIKRKIHLPDISAPIGWLAWDGEYIWTSDSSKIYQIKITKK